jgi:cell shape-determining protein MreD
MERSIIRQIFTGMLVLASQIVVFRHLNIYGAEPDVLTLFVIWLMSFNSRTVSLLLTAVFALSQDILLDLWGLNLFAKTLSVLVFYAIIPKEDELRPQVLQVFLTILAVVFFNNAVMLGLSVFSEALTSGSRLFQLLIGNTIFTTVVGTFLYILRNDKG